ncbi:DUF2905 domain-containing protein [Mesorhizobium sp.]|uniref:DUF2905 domain-containing protein n=1 Tax=Mesorhizobium sp. TaxID=1871066 RepID=UPI00344FAD34
MTQPHVANPDCRWSHHSCGGLLWPWLLRIGLGRLPGDIVIERENFTFYVPIATGS